jgi:hypothetical protein
MEVPTLRPHHEYDDGVRAISSPILVSSTSACITLFRIMTGQTLNCGMLLRLGQPLPPLAARRRIEAACGPPPSRLQHRR